MNARIHSISIETIAQSSRGLLGWDAV